MNLGVPELLILMVIVLLLFGPGRLGNIAGEIGSGIRSFREGLKGDEKEQDKAGDTEPQKPDQSDKPGNLSETEKTDKSETIDTELEKK